MAIDQARPRISKSRSPALAIAWLLDSDPSIRWQVMRDLTDASDDEVAAERARVATEGCGRALLALQAPDGRWGGARVEPRVGLDDARPVAPAGDGSRSRRATRRGARWASSATA